MNQDATGVIEGLEQLPTLRRHRAGGVVGEAAYSPCGTYRYCLGRSWNAAGRRLLVVMLNPSTADHERNDPTLARCEARARADGFGALRVVNLFAFRATRPQDMLAADDPIGPMNDAVIFHCAAVWLRSGDAVLCAWGYRGVHIGRDKVVEALLRGQGSPLHHLGLTAGGMPRHPLYVSHDQPLVPWH